MRGAPHHPAVRFSSRVDAGAPNRIALAEAQALALGVPLRRLNDSNPTRFGLGPSSLPGLYAADPRGPRSAREALAGFLAARGREERADLPLLPADPDRLYLLSSTSEAYAWLITLLCDPGDALLAPRPGYPLVQTLARLESVRVIDYPLRFDGAWTIDIPAVAAALAGPQGDRIRAVVAINPNNPTGSYVKPDERRRLLDLCRRHGVALIADEVFFDYALEPLAGNARLAGATQTLTFELDGFSKLLAAPQAKVGWIRVSGPPADVAQAMRRLDAIADAFLPMSDIIAARVPGLLRAASGQMSRVRTRTQGNLRLLHRLLAADEACTVSVLRAEGGWNVLLHFPDVVDETALVLRLIRNYGLSAQPGYFFDMPSNGYLAEQFAQGVRAVLAEVRAML